MSSPRSNPAGFREDGREGGGIGFNVAVVPPSLPHSLKSADQDSHASLPGVEDYRALASICERAEIFSC